MNFAKKVRGRKTQGISEIPKKLTRRICSSKVGEVFDISGLLAPITGTWKLDLHELITLKLGWDDAIPDNLRAIWETNFEQMSDQRTSLQKGSHTARRCRFKHGKS